MGHHNPKHIQTDLNEIKQLGCDDVFLAIQENDFSYFDGKIKFFPRIASDAGLRPIAIFWGLVNYFGGGKSSQFLLKNPQAHQKDINGAFKPAGCYNNPSVFEFIKQLIDEIVFAGFKAYFIDEPSLIDCYCQACCDLFESMYFKNLKEADEALVAEFRKRSVVHYVNKVSEYIKNNYPVLETMCCIMPCDNTVWKDIAKIKNLDDLGTDIYWVNEDKDVEQMAPIMKEMSSLCRHNNKKHHEWLQCWGVKKGKEQRIIESGNVILREAPDALYVWAYNAQLGTSEACEDPGSSWEAAKQILLRAKQL